jgi:PBP4 family serine-type D-alanyl-D-alanine carboxypeptidase
MNHLSISRLALAVLLAPTLNAQGTLDQRIQQVMDRPEFVHAVWGIEFYDLGAKRTVYSVNRDRLFVPGSTTKLLTTGTAIELLGRDHRFHTRVYRTGPIKGSTLDGDLVLVASGDPNLSGRLGSDGTLAYANVDHSYGGLPLDADPLTPLRGLAGQLAAKGIKRISGRVIVDASLFPEGERELGTRVTISPMVLNDNVVDIVVTPGAKAGDTATVSIAPRTPYLTVRAMIVTGDSGTASALRTSEDSANRDARVLTVTGRVPRGALPANARWTVPVPSHFAEVAFALVLRDAGIEASARTASAPVDFTKISARYADSTQVAEHISAPFSEEAKVILKMSQNLHASMMPMVVARTLARADSTKTGFDFEREWLEKAGLDLNGAVQGDGAGGDAYFSPAFMTRYLGYCLSRPWAPDLKRSLPILGRDGTLALIQPQSPAAGQVFAKTGTFASYDPLHRRLLLHAKGLAGYFTSKSGKAIAFAVFLNNFALEKGDPAALAGQTLGEVAAVAWEFIP